jgi:phosphosulfolactate phosphohydrolase-like enzyme
MSTGQARHVATDGLANLAHAIRRSTAVYVAMSMTPEGSSVEDMLRTADRVAAWINGRAGGQGPTDETFLGVDPFHQ